MKKNIEYLKSIAFRTSILKHSQSEFDLLLSRKFSPFKYIWMNENIMSDIFADLLNPNGAHGQKEAFLKSFISKLPLKNQTPSNFPKIEREVRTDKIKNNKKRIDIVISWDNEFAIGIENKPWTSDSDNQLKDYSDHLKTKYKNYLLIYISENDANENSMSSKEKNQLKNEYIYFHINYSSYIIEWLEECIKSSQSEKIRFFLKDFKSEIQKYFSTMDTQNTNEIVEYALSSPENIESAYEAYKAFPKILEKIAENFSINFIDRLKEKYGHENINILNEIEGDKINIHFSKSSWTDGKRCSLRDHDKDRLYLSAFIENESEKSNFHDFIKDKINGRPNKTQWWDYPSRFNKWMNSPEEIKTFNTSESVEFFLGEFEVIINLIDEYQESKVCEPTSSL
ncbi:PD-(D/E)XK nuclease family protein [uncultured Tenacibaculum sp.]|uniref:PDDEXK-like family protein n=1 Tax=uncultured Tenacibaculum sp. TaxID=174713 RepID=UPI002630C43D|nr:PD-(D/E)XK nuclease family protein [uncultured Tenacibaculum sp.]